MINLLTSSHAVPQNFEDDELVEDDITEEDAALEELNAEDAEEFDEDLV